VTARRPLARVVAAAGVARDAVLRACHRSAGRAGPGRGIAWSSHAATIRGAAREPPPTGGSAGSRSRPQRARRSTGRAAAATSGAVIVSTWVLRRGASSSRATVLRMVARARRHRAGVGARITDLPAATP